MRRRKLLQGQVGGFDFLNANAGGRGKNAVRSAGNAKRVKFPIQLGAEGDFLAKIRICFQRALLQQTVCACALKSTFCGSLLIAYKISGSKTIFCKRAVRRAVLRLFH